jgi:hypothetical protein
MARRILAICTILLCGAALATVPLGAAVTPEVRQGLSGAYFIAFVSPSCLNDQTRAQHWGALETARAKVVRVDTKAVVAPTPLENWRFLNGVAATDLTRDLKVRTLPTTVLVDRENRIRAVFEGVLEHKWVLENLKDFGQ